MDDETGRSARVVRLTEAALLDVAGIDNATASTWGIEQAERYLAHITATFALLLDEPGLGHPIEDWPDYKVYVTKSSNRRAAQGHKIMYRETDYGIRIIRVLHTAMSWPSVLSEED